MLENNNSNRLEFLKSNHTYFVDLQCVQFQFGLTFFNSNWHLLWSGRIFFAFLMVFFFLGLTKAEEFLMISIEKITWQKVKSSFENVETKGLFWSNSFADLTLRALGSNSFEILCPLAQLPFNIYNQSFEQTFELNLLIVIII